MLKNLLDNREASNKENTQKNEIAGSNNGFVFSLDEDF
jgi:hypothetical protein